jgi:hypothetical protein
MGRREPDYYEKRHFDDGAILEIKIYRVRARFSGSQHDLKYSLNYGKEGAHLVAYDNERRKGDHRQYLGAEAPYQFSTGEQLIADFLRDVVALRRRLPT